MDTGELGRDDGRASKQGGRGGAVRPRCAAGLGSSTRAALTDSGSWLLLLEDAKSNRSRGPPGLADGKGKRRGARPMHASTLSLGGSSLGQEFRTSHRHFYSGRSWDERPLPAQPRPGMFPSLHHHSSVQLSAGLPDHPPRTHNWEEFRPKQLTLYHVLRRAGIKNWQHNTTGVDMWTVTTPQRWAPPYHTTYTVMHSHGDTPVRTPSAGLPLPRHQHNILTGEANTCATTASMSRLTLKSFLYVSSTLKVVRQQISRKVTRRHASVLQIARTLRSELHEMSHGVRNFTSSPFYWAIPL
uniref:Uncharacterized protein LOC116946171 isoform X2 n=1 Tax=Petromyzon marinus TaxID=7757 RepID=A0AAJ7TFP1_PETMA|nr:uncharacterized protein LOC116946171 isoform X2 [Petromyzon marinus]